MKYKIIERNDGRFDIFRKANCISPWIDTCTGPFLHLLDCKKTVKEMIKNYQDQIKYKHGIKHKKVIEIIDANS